MDKIKLIVLGLQTSPASTNAYALILKEENGERRLPIIIGAFEAQAIALELEEVVTPRPMTHDLIKNIIEGIGAELTEVLINDLADGTFYAKLIFEPQNIEIDARPSDAIAIAVRLKSPIFVNRDILEETGMLPQGDEFESESGEEDEEEEFSLKKFREESKLRPKNKVEQLQVQLDKAIKDEDYEKAATLRDELKRLLDLH